MKLITGKSHFIFLLVLKRIKNLFVISELALAVDDLGRLKVGLHIGRDLELVIDDCVFERNKRSIEMNRSQIMHY